MPWQQADQHADASFHDIPGFKRGAAPRTGEDHVAKSVRAVERAVENIAALQGDREHYRCLAHELQTAFDEANAHATSNAQQLEDARRITAGERNRAIRAEQRLVQAATTIRELEQQLERVSAKADRLVGTLSRMMSDSARVSDEAVRADLIAA